jgi:nucleotide-binding universal stress UspA family protein
MVPTEGTGFDREAIRVALRLATKSDAVIHLVRVMKSSPMLAANAVSDGIAVAVDTVDAARDQELSQLYMLAAECRELTSATIVTALEDGPIADVLEAYSDRVSPDLIVISSHGRHGIARLSLGSVTDALIRKAHVPVLVVKPEPSYLNPRAAERFSQMIIPLDGSTLAEEILSPALRLAKLEQAEVVLLQVLSAQDEEINTEQARAWWEESLPMAHAYLNRIASLVRGEGLAVSTDIIVGTTVAEAIASFAKSRRAGLIAIATHGRSGLRRAVRGSVADELMRNGATSLLALHPARELADTPSKIAEQISGELVAVS